MLERLYSQHDKLRKYNALIMVKIVVRCGQKQNGLTPEY